MVLFVATFRKIKYFNRFVALAVLADFFWFVNRSLFVICCQLRNKLLKVLIKGIFILGIMFLDKILFYYVILIE
jgi:hypothetical protein